MNINNIKKLSKKRKLKLAKSYKTPFEILKILAIDEDICIRDELALNPNLSDDILKILINDEIDSVRYNVAIHSNASSNTLETLAKLTLQTLSEHNEDYEILIGIVDNPNTSTETLELLTKCKDYYVKEAIVENPNTPNQVLKMLANDEYEEIRKIASNRLSIDNKKE